MPDITEPEPPVTGMVSATKNAEEILERIFSPTPKASPAEQAERTLRQLGVDHVVTLPPSGTEQGDDR